MTGDQYDEGEQRGDTEFSLIDLLVSFIRWRRVIVAGLLVGAAWNGLRIGTAPRTYSATASIISEARDGGLSSISMPGFGGLGGDPTQSASFFANLATSDAVLRKVVEMPVATLGESGDTSRVRTIDWLQVEGSPARKRRLAIEALEGSLLAKVELGAIELTFTATEPLAARDVLAGVIDALNQVNLERWQGSASRERAFAEERMKEALAELTAAEEEEERFLEANREWRFSPSLTIKRDRLGRTVTRRNQVYLARSSAYEAARLDEVRDVPVLSVLSAPEVPTEPDPRGLLVGLVFGAVIGGAVVVVFVALLNLKGKLAEQQGPELDRLRLEVAAATAGAQRLFQRTARRTPGQGGQ